jgi:diguanylate cyclase (GGDEF)-like protein
VTVSIGVAQHRPGEQITAFLQRADQNMYRAKELGRNQTFRS